MLMVWQQEQQLNQVLLAELAAQHVFRGTPAMNGGMDTYKMFELPMV